MGRHLARLATGAEPKSSANWLLVSLFGLLNKEGVSREDIDSIKIKPEQLAALVKLVDDDTLNKGSAEKVLAQMYESGDDPNAIVEREGLAQVSDEAAIAARIDEVLAQNDKMVQRYIGGEDKLFGALMGKTMGAFGGKANPKVVQQVLRAQQVFAQQTRLVTVL